jgi:pyruvate/2-oxoglutarate dehydrogenase complex dihydrolipoamide acyltransferase (E2) component
MLENHIFPALRKHTLCFLNAAKSVTPVYLTAEIDMTNVLEARSLMIKKDKVSFISFFIKVISDVLATYPDANAYYQEKFWGPKLIRFNHVNGKFTLDLKHKHDRFVMSAVIENSDKLSILEIQEKVDSFKQANFTTDDRYGPVRFLQKLPLLIGKFLFKYLTKNPKRNIKLQGSFTVTSLGHNSIDTFLPISGGTLTFGIGQIKDRAIVNKGEIMIKKTAFISIVFDHRVIDGALASDILSTIKHQMESYKAD